MRFMRAFCLFILVLAIGGCGGGGESASLNSTTPVDPVSPTDPVPPESPTPHGFFEMPVLMSGESNGYVSDSSISDNGDAVIVWMEYEPSTNYRAIWANVFDYAKDSWSSQVLLNEDSYYSYYPRVASFPNGDAIVVWEHSIGDRSIYFSMYDKKADSWTDKRSISTGNSNFGPEVVTSSNGNAMIVWQGYENEMWTIFGAIYNAADKTWVVEMLEATSDYELGVSDIQMGPNGHAVIVYQLSGGIYIREYMPSTGWMPSYQVSSQYSNVSARVVMDDNIIAMSWINFSFGYVPQDVHFTKMENGIWSVPKVIESPNTGDSWEPNIAMNNEGIVVIWRHSNWNNAKGDFDNRIWANILTEDGWSGQQLLAENEYISYVSPISAIEDNVVIPIFGPNRKYFKSYSKETGWSTRIIGDHVPGYSVDALISKHIVMLIGHEVVGEDQTTIYANWERRAQ